MRFLKKDRGIESHGITISVGRPPTINSSSALIMEFLFFQLLGILVVLQSLRGKNLQLEWVGSYLSVNRVASESYFQSSQQLAGYFMLCFWKTETYRYLPQDGARLYFMSLRKTCLSASACSKARSVSCPCSIRLKLELAKYIRVTCFETSCQFNGLIDNTSAPKIRNSQKKKLGASVFKKNMNIFSSNTFVTKSKWH